MANTILITGCATGIGNATARLFNQEGWMVYATDPDPEALTALDELGCETRELDVTTSGDPQRVVDEIDAEYGHIDVLFNNAGYGQLGAFEELPTDALEDQFDVNFFGMHRVLRAALPVMRRQHGGTIINVSSVYGRTVFIGQGAYCASKWAVEAMSESLRSEVADHNVDVVVVEPGPVETDFGARALETVENLTETGAYEWFNEMYDDRKLIDKAVGSIQPEEVADTIHEIAIDETPSRRYPVGPWRYRLLVGTALPKSIRDAGRDTAHKAIKWMH